MGSGREDQAPDDVEMDVLARLERRGVRPENVVAMAFVPEVEIALRPVWRRAVDVLASERALSAPDDGLILRVLREGGHAATDVDDAFERHPKELVEALFVTLRLRRSPALYGTLGRKVSIRSLKSGVLGRLSGSLEGWFGSP
jgi:hypothetical protein